MKCLYTTCNNQARDDEYFCDECKHVRVKALKIEPPPPTPSAKPYRTITAEDFGRLLGTCDALKSWSDSRSETGQAFERIEKRLSEILARMEPTTKASKA